MTMPATAQSTEIGSSAPERAAPSVPVLARVAIAGFVGVLLLGAVYLIAVRGEALLVDLAKLGAAFCF